MARILRRRFLSHSLNSAVAAGSVGIVTQAKATMGHDPIGAALIGTTHPHALGHRKALERSRNYTLIGVAEPNPQLAKQAREDRRWEGVNWMGLNTLLADDRVEMVCIETDPLDALTYSRMSVRANKHTKIDKPPGAEFNALKEIFEEAKNRKLLIQMGYVYRYNPAFRLAHRALLEGWLGPIRSAACQMNDMLSAAGRQRLDRYPGGQMFEICGHMIDALIWLLGEPARVSPVLRHSDPIPDELEDDVLAMFEFNPAVAVVKSHTRNGDRYFYLFGEKGSILIDSPDRPRLRIFLSSSHGGYAAGAQEVPLGPSERYLPDLDDLAGAIREDRQTEFFTPEHDLAVQRALLTASGLEL